ncbi:hypothetical protein GCM10007276_14350 [Agaricicola taiwanensis]|uniref:MAPEG family protein n=1 Tax=Agaricicola taiwanensis TaxID=591372 RepID=A0A8J2YGC0_9RHOB|nr:MAPEG family protein [Agaricicola taiwanensis]GGE38056.1 hypothetical protein GCM10007276_14350 [Agaricicola taiwanensis]
MTIQAALLPLFVQVGLTFALMIWMGRMRVGAIRAGELQIRDMALGERVWPARAQQASNAYHNQFELPVLFYVLTVLAIVSQKDDILFVILAWIFVITRLVHAWVHCTSNRVPLRMKVFVVGAVLLMVMWIIYALRILLAF